MKIVRIEFSEGGWGLGRGRLTFDEEEGRDKACYYGDYAFDDEDLRDW